MSTTKALGLLGIAMATAMTAVALPAMAQRVCVESESNGRVVCGRVINDARYNDDRTNNQTNDRYDRDANRDDDRTNSRYDNRNSDANSFDERFYLMAYPDVKAAVSRGQFRDALTHYRKAGRYEGRFPRFSEASYLAKNPDIADAVRHRSIRSGYDHWVKIGRFENRKL